MRYLFIVFLVCLTVSAFTTADFGGVRASHSVALVNEQRRLLVELDAMNNPYVSQFVRDWRVAYPRATDSSVEELSLAAAAIKSDPSRAKTMTRSARQKALDNLPFTPVFSGTPEAKPGL